MCDTFIADHSVESGYKIFGKNSDREPNEAQAIVRFNRRHATEKELQVTFIKIPQVAETYEVILSKPFHMWGAEMGVNEYGVVIGNEAVFTKEKFKKENTGLTGMDLVRLALERSNTAKQALTVITTLLEKYGQDACGGYIDKNFYYHNSFIIADYDDQYILETAGRHWVAKQVYDYAAISNGLFIEDDYDLCSRSVKDMEKGKMIHFARQFSDRFMSYLARCNYRKKLSEGEGAANKFDVRQAIDILSSHGENEPFIPSSSNMKALCIHASGLFTPHQTTGSMVVKLSKGYPITVWLSGTSSPCISLYTPFYFGGQTLTGNGLHLPDAMVDQSLWWKGEVLQRALLRDYARLKSLFDKERVATQTAMIQSSEKLIKEEAKAEELDGFAQIYLLEHVRLLDQWNNLVAAENIGNYSGSLLYKRFRNAIDKKVNMGSRVG